MENTNEPVIREENSNRPWHRWHHGHEHMVLRWLLGILILIGVFCLGVHVGKFHAEFGGYGHGGFGHRGPVRGYRMMGQPMGTFNAPVAPQTAPAANAQPQPAAPQK